MSNPNDHLKMPVKVQPYEHQKKAFAFALRMFGVFGEGDNQAADKKITISDQTVSWNGRKMMPMTPISKDGKGCALLMEM